MDMKGWDVVYASSTERLNTILAAHPHQLLSSFSYSDATTGVDFSGTFGPWAIRPGGSADRINVRLPISEGTLAAPGLSVLLNGTEPVVSISLQLINCGFTEQEVVFDIRRAGTPSADEAAAAGDVYVKNPDESGLLARRDPSGQAAMVLADGLPAFLAANAAKISFVFASVFTAPHDRPWLRPKATGIAYFESIDHKTQALAIKTLTQARWSAAGLSTGVDPELIGHGDALCFAVSQEVLLRDLLQPGLPRALGGQARPEDFRFNPPPSPDRQNDCSISAAKSFHTRSVEHAGTSYHPRIDRFDLTVSGGRITTRASGQFDISHLAGAWVSFRNLQVVNELYYDPKSRRVKFRLVSKTKPSVDKHIPWEYRLLPIAGIIGAIVELVIDIVVTAVDNAVQDSLSGTGDLSVGSIPVETAIWTGLKEFSIDTADLKQALVFRATGP